VRISITSPESFVKIADGCNLLLSGFNSIARQFFYFLFNSLKISVSPDGFASCYLPVAGNFK